MRKQDLKHPEEVLLILLNKIMPITLDNIFGDSEEKSVSLDNIFGTISPQTQDFSAVNQAVASLPNPKIEQYNKETEKAQKESEKANSFWGMTKNFLSAVPGSFVDVGKNLYKGLKEPLIAPNEQQQQYEEKYFPEQPKGIIRTLTKPGQTAAKYITRFLAPALQSLGNDIAEIKAINEKGGIADQISSGKIPPEVLNEFAVLQKTAPQIVGDVAQAVLSAYAGGAETGLLKTSVKQSLRQSLKQGLETGLATGELFGGAQAASSGSKNPLEIAGMIGTSGAAGGVLGLITSGAIPVSKEILGKVKEAKILYDSMSPAEKQAGFAKNPFFKEELNPLAEKAKTMSKEEFVNQFDKGLNGQNLTHKQTANNALNLIKESGLKDPADFYDKVVNQPTSENINSIVEQVRSEQKTIEQQPGQLQQPGKEGIVPSKEKIQEGQLPSKKETIQELAQVEVKPSLQEIIPKDFNVDKYIKEQIKKREIARTAEKPTTMGKAKKFLANAKKKLVDFSAPIEDVLSETVKKHKIKLAPEKDIHNQIDRVLRAPTIAGEFAREHGLTDIIQKVDNIDNLDQYLIAKHAIELDAKGIKTGREITKDKALVESYKGKYESYAKQVSDYSRKLLDYSVESGLISKEVVDLLKERYPDYVPFNRVFNELEKSGGFEGRAGGVASLSKQDVVQKIEGSTREVESPLESLLTKTNDAFKQGEKNKAGKILAEYKDLPDNPFQLRELEKGETAKNTISFFDDGVKRTFETTPDVAQAAKSLNVQQLNILGKIFALPVRVARVGITGINFPFIAANLAKDQVTAFINSNHSLATSLANPSNFIKSLFSAVEHDKLYKEMVKEGGGGTSFDIAREQAPKTIKQIRASKSIPSKILYIAKNPSQLLRAIEDIVAVSEELTRVQQYRGTREALIKKGTAPETARIEAARAARENTVNFARRGEWGNVLNSAFLYLNAGIQGTRTLLRNLKEKPVQTAAKIAIAGFTPVAMATAWNLSSPDRKEAYEDIAEYEKQNNIIIVPPNPKKDENGKWNVIKIPLSQEISNLVSLVRRPIEAASGLAPLEFKDFSKAIIGTVEPIEPTKGAILSTFTPQAIKPTIEAAVNKVLFTGFPIVPQNMEKLSPENQVKPGTSGSVRKIAKLLDVSPLKVEAFIKGTFGGIGPQAENIVDQVMAELGTIPKDQIGGQDVLDAITARFTKASGGEKEQGEIKKVQELITKQADEAYLLKNEAEAKWKELKTLPKEQAAVEFDKLDPQLADKISTIAQEEAKGLTVADRFIKQLQVTNGERAKYLAEQFNKLLTKEEKANLWQEYTDKGIISTNVADQLQTLLNK